MTDQAHALSYNKLFHDISLKLKKILHAAT
jgi:hypothetical protein